MCSKNCFFQNGKKYLPEQILADKMRRCGYCRYARRMTLSCAENNQQVSVNKVIPLNFLFESTEGKPLFNRAIAKIKATRNHFHIYPIQQKYHFHITCQLFVFLIFGL